jgi:hypothetical protein
MRINDEIDGILSKDGLSHYRIKGREFHTAYTKLMAFLGQTVDNPVGNHLIKRVKQSPSGRFYFIAIKLRKDNDG